MEARRAAAQPAPSLAWLAGRSEFTTARPRTRRAAAAPGHGAQRAGVLTAAPLARGGSPAQVIYINDRRVGSLAKSFGRTGGLQQSSAVSDGIRRLGSTREACSASMTLGFSMPHPVLPQWLRRQLRRGDRLLRGPLPHRFHQAGAPGHHRVPRFAVAAKLLPPRAATGSGSQEPGPFVFVRHSDAD